MLRRCDILVREQMNTNRKNFNILHEYVCVWVCECVCGCGIVGIQNFVPFSYELLFYNCRRLSLYACVFVFYGVYGEVELRTMRTHVIF